MVQLGFLGDIVLSSAVWNALRAEYPEAEISLLTTPLGAGLSSGTSDFAQVISFDKRGSESGIAGLLRKAKELKSCKFDTVYSLHKSYRTAFLLYLARIPRRVGFDSASASFLYTERKERLQNEHEVLRNASVLQGEGEAITEENAKLSLSVSEEARAEANTLVADCEQPFVTMAPGSVWATKRWPAEYFAKLADHIAAKGFRVVLIGGPAERDVAEVVQAGCSARLINTVGRTTPQSSAALISESVATICNDSAPLHIASAMGTPVLVFFCATVPEFGFGPWKIPNRILGVAGLPCRPCGRHGRQYCPTGTHACQKDLTPEMSFAAFDDLLKEIAPSAQTDRFS